MTHPHERALEAAARAARLAALEEAAVIAETWFDHHRPQQPKKSRFNIYDIEHWAKSATRLVAEDIRARAAVTAYIAAMPPPVSPELIDRLNKLASYLTEQGEYEAVDLIDTVVARVSAMPGRELLAEALEALTEIARDDIGGLQAIYEAHKFDPGDYDKDTCVARLRSWMEDEATYLMGRISYHRTRARTAANKIRDDLKGEA